MLYNEVVLVGRIITIATFKDIYMARLEVARTSGNIDTIPLEIPSHVLNDEETILNQRVKVTGKLFSPSKLRVLVEVIFQTEDEDCNSVYVTGFIYRKGRYKNVSDGKPRTDFTIMTECLGESAVVPCIAWNKTAKWAAKLETQERVEVIGRLQSRKYRKVLDDDTSKLLETFEVSASRMRLF